MVCPRCGSSNYSTHKRGYSWTYGCLGVLVLNIFGLLLGRIGSNKIVFYCRDCGEEWTM